MMKIVTITHYNLLISSVVSWTTENWKTKHFVVNNCFNLFLKFNSGADIHGPQSMTHVMSWFFNLSLTFLILVKHNYLVDCHEMLEDDLISFI